MTTTTPSTNAPAAEETIERLLPSDLLAAIDERAPIYDRENTFFTEDFEALKATGFLNIAVPEEFGGSGLLLDQVSQALRRLAYVAPASAVAVNMHIYWTGVAADLLRAGDESARFVLEEAGAGKIFAAIHGEAGNDIPVLLSSASAEKVDGGWKVNGHKIFGSLSPVWDYAGFHAMDATDPSEPKIVHAFFRRDTPGVDIVETWDTLGMRATQSHDTVLTDAVAPDDMVVRVCPPGFAGADLFHVSVFAWALLGFAAVYHGAARRAYDITLAKVPTRSSVALTNSMAHHPEVQHHISEMRIALDASEALLDRTTGDWATGVEHADWPVRIVGTRYRVITESFDIVDRALDLSGGAGVFKRNRLEQIFRDVRMGRFHPGNTFLAHELIAKLCLGIDPDDPQRWG
ncbi:MAG: acyl-CoA dehydrogenase family protein [Acidimicrobiales bacterium]